MMISAPTILYIINGNLRAGKRLVGGGVVDQLLYYHHRRRKHIEKDKKGAIYGESGESASIYLNFLGANRINFAECEI